MTYLCSWGWLPKCPSSWLPPLLFLTWKQILGLWSLPCFCPWVLVALSCSGFTAWTERELKSCPARSVCLHSFPYDSPRLPAPLLLHSKQKPSAWGGSNHSLTGICLLSASNLVLPVLAACHPLPINHPSVTNAGFSLLTGVCNLLLRTAVNALTHNYKCN